MIGFTAIDLSKLPAPRAVEVQDFEAILSGMLTDFSTRFPEFDVPAESDPAYKLLEAVAYRILIERQAFNERSLQNLLAFASGPELEHLAAYLGVERQLVSPENLDTIPPTPAVYEDDQRLRYRTQLALEGFSVAGSRGAYLFHTLSVSPEIKHASVVSPSPGLVRIAVLSTDDDGTPSGELLGLVLAALSDEDKRPLTDQVEVVAPIITPYAIEAELTLYPGPDAEVVQQAALERVLAYAEARHRLGQDVTLSGLYAALHVEGVQNVNLISPAASLVADDGSCYYNTAVTLSIAGVDE